MSLKDTNPKDAIGATKLPMHLVPSAVPVLAAQGFLEGALKYGKYNWRVAGVRISIYLDAMRRHMEKLQNGEWRDPVTQVPHLASLIACAGIIEDARICGKLIDDRPPAAPYGAYIDETVDVIAHLKEVFKSHNPHQHTIQDPIYDHKQEEQSTGPAAEGPQPGNKRHPRRKAVPVRGKGLRRR